MMPHYMLESLLKNSHIGYSIKLIFFIVFKYFMSELFIMHQPIMDHIMKILCKCMCCSEIHVDKDLPRK